jgi:hypothetical protein
MLGLVELESQPCHPRGDTRVLLAVYPLSNLMAVTPSYRNRRWYLLRLSDRSGGPPGLPTEFLSRSVQIQGLGKRYPLSIARFVDPAAPCVALTTQHEGHRLALWPGRMALRSQAARTAPWLSL